MAAEILNDWLLGGNRPAQVAMQHIPEVDGVLLVKRAIESPTVPERGHHLRVGCGLLAEIGSHGIGGNRLRKNEADQGHTDQHWSEQEESPDDVALKCYRRSLAVSRIATMVSQQVSKSVGRLVGWSVGRLVGWSVGRLLQK